jgi:hypothetical protein
MVPMLISSDDHGRTWTSPRPRIKQDQHGAPGMVMSYLGNGQLIDICEESGEDAAACSNDYGETWQSFPSTHTASGFPFIAWDPCLVDRDEQTGELKRIIASGCSQGMDRQFDAARRVLTLPNEWHWKYDADDRGNDEQWYKDASFADWPRTMTIDKHWTLQGEPAGVGWYATAFEMPDVGDMPLVALFGAVDGYCDVFIDGEKVGEQKKSPEVMWTRPFYVELAKPLSPGRHTMVVRVDKQPAPDTNAGIYLPVALAEDILRGKDKRDYSWPRQNAMMRISYDGGRTWPDEIHPPAWNGDSGVGANEIALCRAVNGDIIAACRIVDPDYYGGKSDPERHSVIDHYCGLGVSRSTDNGQTWSNIDVLYHYGRMHPSMVVLPDGTMVMTYAVRLGALKPEHRAIDADGFSKWSVEAIISTDHGVTWDLSRRYVLAAWSGAPQAQSTSTVVLPDGSLLTACGTGYLSRPIKADIAPAHEICLVRWQVA